MDINELQLNIKTKKMIRENGFSKVEELVSAFKDSGYNALNLNEPLPPDVGSDDPKYQVINSKRNYRRQSFKRIILPELIRLGHLEELPSEKEIRNSIGKKLIGIAETLKLLRTSSGSLNRFLGTYIKESSYVVAYEDFYPDNHQQTYLFIEEDIKEVASKYAYTLEEVAKALNISIESLTYFVKNKLTEEELAIVRVGEIDHSRNWYKDWFIENIDRLFTTTKREYGSVDYTRFFSKELNSSIKDYLIARRNGEEIEFDGTTYFSEPFKTDKSAERFEKYIVRSLYKIKCGRAEIKDFTSKIDVTSEKRTSSYRKLSKDEEQKLKNLDFDIKSFNSNDMKYVYNRIENDGTKIQTVGALKPFLYYILMLEENKYFENLEKSHEKGVPFDNQTEREKLFLMKRRFDKALKTERARKKPKKKRSKFFGTRSDIISCFKTLLKNEVGGSKGGLRYPIKSATVMLMGFLTGIRPLEMIGLEIDKHLDIEKDPNHPNFGLLKKYKFDNEKNILIRSSVDDKDGWGRLWVTEEISKGTYSPSPDYGTFLVPRLVDFLNRYLSWLYSGQLSVYEKGTGFLFRADNKIPTREYKDPSGLTGFIRRWRDEFPFLDPEQIKDFRYYETRHTVNNLIVNRTLITDQQINEWKVRVAEIHCRHSIDNDDPIFTHSKSDINEEAYQQTVPLNIYLHILENALNFPFDESALNEWEKTNNPLGAKGVNNNNVVHEQPEENSLDIIEGIIDQETVAKIKKLEEELNVKEERMSNLAIPRLSKKLYGLEKIERLKEIERTHDEIEHLKNQIQTLKGSA